MGPHSEPRPSGSGRGHLEDLIGPRPSAEPDVWRWRGGLGKAGGLTYEALDETQQRTTSEVGARRGVGAPAALAAVDADGSQVAQARRTPKGYLGGLAAGSPPVLTLAPGESASALVEALAFNAFDGSACKAFGGLLVTVPDDTVATRLPWDSDGCSDLEVHPVVAGTTGRSG